MTKNEQITQIENEVLTSGYPVYQAWNDVMSLSITQGVDFASAAAAEFKKLQNLNREWISNDRTCPVRTSIYIRSRNYDFRRAIAEGFAFAGSSHVRSSSFDDYMFVANPGSDFAGYSGQPCIWFSEMKGKDLLHFCDRMKFLSVFEPYPDQPVTVSVPHSYRLLHNGINVISTNQDFQCFVETINADGKKTPYQWERDAIGQITRRLPIVVNVLDDNDYNGSCEILVHKELLENMNLKKITDPAQIPSEVEHYGEIVPRPIGEEPRTIPMSNRGNVMSGRADSECYLNVWVDDEYTKMFSVVVDQEGDLHVYNEREPRQEIMHASCSDDDWYTMYSYAMRGIAMRVYRALRRR